MMQKLELINSPNPLIMGMSSEVYLQALSYIESDEVCKDIIVVDLRDAFCEESSARAASMNSTKDYSTISDSLDHFDI